ncbi:MAG TPA: NAD(P)H-hydrate dehydratase [Acidisarcina sp.]|nr:NAD(P)H-hydrate dehydratase [Acidisarcina sp.]
MKILTADEMRSTDQRTVEQFGVDSLTLMEHAGTAVAQFIVREYPAHLRITVLCGGGNNGGDGFVAARLLRRVGHEVSVLLLADPADVKGDARTMLGRMSLTPTVVRQAADLESPEVRDLFHQSQLFVDAVLGTGFKPPLRPLAAQVGTMINASAVPVVAVDLPSGWDADTRLLQAPGAFRADAVVTFTAPKPAHIFGNLTRGPIVVAAIGSPSDAIQSAANLSWAGSSKKIVEQPRPVESNKGAFGHVLVIGGSKGKSGAPSMAALAALRAGAGLVTAAIPDSILASVAGVTPELMTAPLIEGKYGEIVCRNLEAGNLKPLLERKTVVALGPGLGREQEAADFAMGLLNETSLPMVIDADGLNAFADGHTDLLDGRDRTLILTPHPGEMARLVGMTIPQVQERREEVARDFAVGHSVTLVLKGHRTLVAHPDGSISANTSGNPGMAKGGSGDVLTGIVAAMIAQYPEDVPNAVNTAVYLHGLAADFAVREQDEHTLLATDIIAALFHAFRFRPQDKDGYVWIQGISREAVTRTQ